MHTLRNLLFTTGALLLIFLVNSCTSPVPQDTELYYPDARPRTRWWWFAGEINNADIRYQLDWARAQGLGGVEIAWVYPLYRYDWLYERLYGRIYAKDTTAPAWLGSAWQEKVSYTKRYADSIGLSCDFTFGSAWPVGGSHVPPEDGTQIYGDTTFDQLITFSWEYPLNGRVIDHLDSGAFRRFAAPINEALKPAMAGSPSGLFTDSWEIKLNGTNKIWTDGFGEAFQARFGYDLIPYMEDSLDNFPEVRYDYMMLLSDKVIENFYKPFVANAHSLGGFARVQCLASPTDVMEAYQQVDLPETEALLNNPNYSRIVSSAAALAGKAEVSCEAFTCMYGFPGTNLREEQTADLKLLADALFAQGVNQIFYHGMPYNPAGSDSVDFFATVYVGPGGSLSDELPAFNRYMERVCHHMKKGHPHSQLAMYMPFEDHVMAGALPKARQRVWVWGKYEMRYLFPPENTLGYHPLWINRSFLEAATFEKGKLRCGSQAFEALYVNVEYLDARSLSEILRLGRAGLPIYLGKKPAQPGKVKNPAFEKQLDSLLALPQLSDQLENVISSPPLLQADSLPDFWCRQHHDTLFCFFAHPFTRGLAYPMTSGDSYTSDTLYFPLTLSYRGKKHQLELRFAPYQSLLLRVDPKGRLHWEDIYFLPKKPLIKAPSQERMYF